MPDAPRPSSARYYLIAAACLALIGVISFSYVKDYRRTREINRELELAQQEIAALQSRKVELQDLLKYFDSEAYAETRARLELGLVRPGEKVIVVPPTAVLGADGRQAAGGQGAGPTGPGRPLSAWWAHFFKRHVPPAT